MTASSFLSVRQSATGKRWVERLEPRQANIALEMSQSLGMPDVLARVLAARGVETANAHAFLAPAIRDLMPDPRSVTDLEKAASRIAAAIEGGESVAIFGDYDVDGAASSALLARYLHHFGLKARIRIPDRIFEGYGPNPVAMKELASEASLIVTVDCGTNSAAAFEAIAGSQTDIVVLDHHQVSGELPACQAVVNPNRQDDLSGLGSLCAAGVVFMTLVEVSRQLREKGRGDLPDLMALLDLVALATICDVVPLTGLNRAFVRRGVDVARSFSNPGLAALVAVSRVSEPVNPYHFGYMIGPRINAGGRIGDASLGARLLVENDRNVAAALAADLDRLNAERQAIEAAMVEEARAEAERELQSSAPPAVLLLASKDWHPGIVGLIAARVKEATGRPAFAISLDPSGKGTGSGRSIPGFDIGRIVARAVDEGLLVKGGGHAMAAGLTVEQSKLGALRTFFNDRATVEVDKLLAASSLKIDGALAASGATVQLIETLEKAGPFGTGNPQPVFAFPRHQVGFLKEVGTGHLKVSLTGANGQLDAIAFKAKDTPLEKVLLAGRDQPIHIAGTLSLNVWNGRAKPQLRIIDAAIPE